MLYSELLHKVWLEVYVAAVRAGSGSRDAALIASNAVLDFKREFAA